MNNTNKLLDNYKKVCLLASDNAAAERLGLTRATLSGWRHGKSHANAEAVERMCIAIGAPVRSWLPLIEAERARTPADRKVWLRLAGGAAALALAIGATAGLDATAPAEALIVLAAPAHSLEGVYIMSILALGLLLALRALHHRSRSTKDAVSMAV